MLSVLIVGFYVMGCNALKWHANISTTSLDEPFCWTLYFLKSWKILMRQFILCKFDRLQAGTITYSTGFEIISSSVNLSQTHKTTGGIEQTAKCLSTSRLFVSYYGLEQPYWANLHQSSKIQPSAEFSVWLPAPRATMKGWFLLQSRRKKLGGF